MQIRLFPFGKCVFYSGKKAFPAADKVYFSAAGNEKFKRIILASIDFVGTKSNRCYSVKVFVPT